MAQFDMRVAIDAGPLESGHKVRGVGFYTKSLIDALGELSREVGGLKIDAFNFEKEPMKLKTGYYDIIHIPYFDPFRNTLPKEKTGKLVVTIHDVIPLLYPKQYDPGVRGFLRFLKHKKLIKSTVDAIITDTESSKKDIVRLLNIPERFIYPVYLAPRALFKPIKDRKELTEVQRRYNLPHTFVLYVGDVNYNKNIPALIKACDIADVALVMVGKQAKEITNDKLPRNAAHDVAGRQMTNGGIRDVIRRISGRPHPEEAHWEELRELFKKNKNIYRLSFIPDEDLLAIFNLATVYCQSSFYEGFGLGSVEAMASGTAVVSARTQALVEVADDAALYADPKNPKGMAKQIEKVLKDSYVRAALIRAGEKRVAAFSWKKTAQDTLAVYKRVFLEERRMARREKTEKSAM